MSDEGMATSDFRGDRDLAVRVTKLGHAAARIRARGRVGDATAADLAVADWLDAEARHHQLTLTAMNLLAGTAGEAAGWRVTFEHSTLDQAIAVAEGILAEHAPTRDPQVDRFTTPGPATWTKPEGAVWVEVETRAGTPAQSDGRAARGGEIRVTTHFDDDHKPHPGSFTGPGRDPLVGPPSEGGWKRWVLEADDLERDTLVVVGATGGAATPAATSGAASHSGMGNAGSVSSVSSTGGGVYVTPAPPGAVGGVGGIGGSVITMGGGGGAPGARTGAGGAGHYVSATAMTRPAPVHFLDFTGGYATLVCKAGESAACRCGCWEQCNAWSHGDPCDHPKTRPVGYCNIKTTLEEDDVAAGCEDDHPLVPVRVRVVDGAFRWRITGPPVGAS